MAVPGVTVIRQTSLVVVLVVALVSAPAAGATGATGGSGHAAVGDAPPADTGTCSFPVTATDATGRQVTISEDPDEVFVLGPSAAQTMWEIGAQDEVVGVSYGSYSYVDYLDGIKEKTNAGSSFTPSISVIVNEDPDLVLAANIIPDSVIDSLRNSGLTVYKFREAESIDFVIEKTRDYGEFVGHCEDANERADRMETEVDLIRSATASVEREEGLYLLGSSGYAAGQNTFAHEMIRTAGIENIAAKRFDGYSVINTEVVLLDDPRWLVRTYEFDTTAYAGATFEDEENYIDVDDNYMNQPGPRIVRPMKTIVKAVHPKAYENANLKDIGDDDSPDKWTAVDANGVAVLTAENAPSATSSFSFPDSFEANNSTVHLESLSVTAESSGETYLTTVSHSKVYTGDRIADDIAATYTLEAGGLTEAQFVNATLEFSVPRTALDARRATADDVSVWVSSRISWLQLDTEVVNESAERVRFRVTLPREAPFVVAMPPVVEDTTTDANATSTETGAETETATPGTAETTTTAPETATTVGTPDATASMAGTATDASSTGTPTSGSGPGPGIVGSLVALLAAAILLVRRTR